MRQPSKLRYVECELPDEVEKAIIAFEDDFDDRLKPFYDRLADFVANELPAIQTEMEAQIKLRGDLLTGSPVKSLSSLEALDASTGLTSPTRDNNDPETIRIDERKIGASGICLLNGRMFKILSGNRLEALRYLWDLAGRKYDYFVRLGTSVYTNTLDSYLLFESNNYDSTLLPFVNKGFTYIDSVGLKNSQYKHRLIWNRGISASFALKTKLVTLGFDSEQINNIFSGYNPDKNYDYLGTIKDISNLIRAIVRIIFLPQTDPIRQPPWENESNYIMLAIKKFLEYRTKKYTTSNVFDPDYWTLFLTELRPKDVKELLENRPEINNIELPQDMNSITTAVEKAIAVPSETTIINTYMNHLPSGKQEEINMTNSLYDLGLAIYRKLKTVNETKAAQLEQLLLELIGKPQLIDFINGNILIDPADLSALFPTTNLPPIGPLVDALKTKEDPDLVNAAISANSNTKKYEKSETDNFNGQNLLSDDSATNNTPSGSGQGFPSEETFAMMLARRIDWASNFTDCRGEKATGLATAPSTQSVETIKDASTTHSGDAYLESNDKWRQQKDNLAYVKSQLAGSVPTITMAGETIEDIRYGMNIFLDHAEANGQIALNDTKIIDLKSEMNTSNDIKVVTSKAVEIIKMTPAAPPVKSTVTLASEAGTGFDRGVGMYAAKNRNYVEEQGGKKEPPGVTTKETREGLERALKTPLPFLGKDKEGENDVMLPFKASSSVELQVCQTKALKEFDNYLKGLVKPPGWLVRFINICKQMIINFQDKIDKYITTAQQTMDALLAKLERLLTIDLNFSGKLGFDNSLFKCSWGIDLGLKINLLDLLLMYLDRFLGMILGPILKFLGLLGDFINEILCIPIRWLGTILNGAFAVLSELLGKIGCTVKDFKLPQDIFDLLGLINGMFSLRSLVFKKGSADWLKMMGRIKLGKNEFTGLSQFASVCANPNLAASLAALQAAMGLAVSDIPVTAVDKGVDGGSSSMSNVA